YSCTTFPTPYYTLGDIVITETAKDEITQCGCVQTLILTAPTNFEFEAVNPGPGTATVTESVGDDVTAVTMVVDATTITVTITTNGGGTSLTDIVTISGIRVRGINGVTGASTVTRTGGSQAIVGDVNGTVHATLDSQNGGPAPTTSAAGPDQLLVQGTTTLAGNTPSVGTGNWSVVSGVATITTPTSETSGVTGLTAGASATLRWKIMNNGCESSDDVTISRYCVPDYPTASEHICRVIFNTIDNSSTCATGGATYEDYTSISTTVTTGSSYDITVYGNTAGNFTNYINVFIDFNQNGVFTDAGEEFQIGTINNCSNCSVTGSITIDPGAVIGPTVMRVMKKYNAYSATACNTTGYGQAEDYALEMCGVSPPTAPATTGAARCGTGTLGLTASGAGAGEDYKWYDAAIGGTLLQTNGSSYTTPSISVTTTYYACLYNTTTTCAESNRIATIATINNAPAITGQPASASACATGEAEFSISATGDGLTYQWQEDNGGGFTNITNGGIYSGATTTTLSLTGVTAPMNSYKYRCVISGICTPAATSDGLATLTIDAGTAPTTANAGFDQSVSAATTTLAGNTITVGTGLWTVVSGTATITTDTDPNSGVTGLAAAPSLATLRWTSTNGGCSTQDDMVITRYCIGTYTNDCAGSIDINITRVVVAGIDNSSSCTGAASANYTSYTNSTGVVQQGLSYPITLTHSGTTNSCWWGIWVDWSKDGDFLDADEFMSTINAPAGTSTVSGTVVVPAGQAEGNYIMRIRAKFSTAMTQATICDNYTYGEQEDYTLKVVPPHCSNSALDASEGETSVDCGGPCFTAVAGTISGGGSVACGVDYTLTAVGAAGEIQWQYSTTNAAPWIDINGETGSTYTDNSNNTTYYRLKVSGGSCSKVFSPSITVTITGTATLYWRTSGGGTDWATATNWWTTAGGPTTAGAAPTACDNAVVQSSTADPTIGSNATCNNLTIDAGATLTLGVGNNNYLTVSGSIINNGTLTQTTAGNTRGMALAGINTTWGGSSTVYNNLTVKIADNSDVTLTSDVTLNTMDAKKVAFGGILSLSTKTLKILTEFDQSGAILHVDSGLLWLAITTSMAIDPSAMEPDYGTVFFDLNGNWTITGGWNEMGSRGGFYNLRERSLGGTLTNDTDHRARNDFTIESGAGTVAFSGGTAYTTQVERDFINNDGFTPGLTTVSMEGSVAQQIGGTTASTFYNLTIKNTAAAGTGVTQNLPVTVSNVFALTDGEFILNSNTATVTSAATTAITRTDGYVVSETDVATNNSILQWNIGSTTGDHIFPFGTAAGDYIPVTFNNQGNTSGDVSISTRPTAADDNLPWTTGVTDMGGTGTNITSAADRWWEISCVTNPVVGGADVTFSYVGAENATTTGATDTRAVQHWTGSFWNDGKGGANGTETTSGNAGVTTGIGAVAVTGLTEFSPFIVVRSGSPLVLPINLLYFDAEYNKDEKVVDLTWVTASETNNDFFTIERSANGIDFESIETVAGAGNSNSTLYYGTVDPDHGLGVIYYRLKQTDYDGQFAYSDVAVVQILKPLQFAIRPNPARDYLEVSFGSATAGSVAVLTPAYDAKISIFDATG
ncbi:MAG: hypothetical protein JKX74_03540, partial [Flavobacteriales bacterium]|nr:hypothetical protein [Flavobacteriales bacterium]